MTDIILVNTNQHNFENNYKKLKLFCFGFPFIEPVLPHIGLCSLASILKEKGFSVKIIDGHLFYLTNPEIIDMIIESNPRLVGITVTSPNLPEIYNFIKELRDKSRKHFCAQDLKIIVGGPHISAMPDSVTELNADLGCAGEAEQSLPLICDYYIREKGNLSEIKGVINGGGDNKTELQLIEDLDSLPPPAFGLYLLPPRIKSRILTIPMSQSRGCAYNCIFCSSRYLSRGRIRFESIPGIIRKIEDLIERYRPGFISFIDNYFTSDRNRVLEFVSQIRHNKIKINWGCQTHADSVDEELLKEMSSAGCRLINFGIETGVDSLRRSLNKNITSKRYVEVFKECRRQKIKACALFMLGFPQETRGNLLRTLRFAREIKPDYLVMQMTVMFPGTGLFMEEVQKKRISPGVWSKYMHNKTNLPFYVPEGLSLKELQNVRIKAYLAHYLSFSFLMKVLFSFEIRYWLKDWMRLKFAVLFLKFKAYPESRFCWHKTSNRYF